MKDCLRQLGIVFDANPQAWKQDQVNYQTHCSEDTWSRAVLASLLAASPHMPFLYLEFMPGSREGSSCNRCCALSPWFFSSWKSVLPFGFSQNVEQPGEMLVQ